MQPRFSWIELDRAALAHNVATFKRLAGERELMVVVKANAYGHGMVSVAQVAVATGADWLAVFGMEEAFALRDAGIDAPVLVFGPSPAESWPRAAAEGIRITVSDPDAAARVVQAAVSGLKVHLKLESGTHRQGFSGDALAAAAALHEVGGVSVEGAYTHFADIEDTTDHAFARGQLERFIASAAALAERGVRPPRLHTACTAAALLFESTYFDLLRVGIGTYGLWPSKETLVSVRQGGREPVELEPVMRWKAHVTQVKEVPIGASVGYGRTFKTTRPSRLAVLPVGYANGYDRHLSNRAHVLIHGQRAPVRGRVAMNMTVVDVTDIRDGVRAGDEAVLLGPQGDEVITAEMMAGWLDTISYEVVTRAEPFGERRLV